MKELQEENNERIGYDDKGLSASKRRASYLNQSSNRLSDCGDCICDICSACLQ